VTLNDLERGNSPSFALFTDFDSFAGRLRHSVIMSATYRLISGRNCPTRKSHGLFATSKLFVSNSQRLEMWTVSARCGCRRHRCVMLKSRLG